MKDKKYNGWTNYETWNVALWIDNDQGSQEYWAQQAQEHYDRAEAEKLFTRKENASFTLRDALQESWEEQNPLKEQYSCFTDLLNAALGEVNWQEIAENLLESVIEEVAEQQ